MIKRYFEIIGRKSKKAFENKVKKELKNKVLNHYALLIKKNKKSILLQNKKDIDYAKKNGLKDNFISRLELDTKKLGAITSSINSISKLKKIKETSLCKYYYF